jgi:hypothetical protein
VRRGIVAVGVVLLLAGCGAGESALKESFDTVGGAMPPTTSASSATMAAPLYQDEAAAIDRKVIVNASIDLEVEDPEAAALTVTRLAEGVGGYVESENLYHDANSETTFAQLQVRVPAESLSGFLETLKGEALDVRSLTTSSQDISEAYTDLEAQLRNLTAYEEELRLLLSDVRERPDAKPDDLLMVFESLRQVRGEIEQLQGRQRLYDSQVALATVSVSLTPSEAVEPIAREGWDAGSILRGALRGLVAAFQWIASALIWFGVFVLPILILLAMLVAIVVWLTRRRSRRRQEVGNPAD